MTTRLLRLAACCAAAVCIWACGPVYIPVPPPTAATQTAFTAQLVTDPAGTQTTLWIAQGAPHPPASNGMYYLVDLERRAGVIAPAAVDGSYLAPPLEGTEGDHVQVQYLTAGGVQSDVACVVLSERRDFAALCAQP